MIRKKSRYSECGTRIIGDSERFAYKIIFQSIPEGYTGSDLSRQSKGRFIVEEKLIFDYVAPYLRSFVAIFETSLHHPRIKNTGRYFALPCE